MITLAEGFSAPVQAPKSCVWLPVLKPHTSRGSFRCRCSEGEIYCRFVPDVRTGRGDGMDLGRRQATFTGRRRSWARRRHADRLAARRCPRSGAISALEDARTFLKPFPGCRGAAAGADPPVRLPRMGGLACYCWVPGSRSSRAWCAILVAGCGRASTIIERFPTRPTVGWRRCSPGIKGFPHQAWADF